MRSLPCSHFHVGETEVPLHDGFGLSQVRVTFNNTNKSVQQAAFLLNGRYVPVDEVHLPSVQIALNRKLATTGGGNC